MKSFSSLGEFALHLVKTEMVILTELHEGLVRVVKRIEKTAKSEAGHYQPQVGPFAAWDELADGTKDDRVRLGFTENDPLLRTGQRRDDISSEAHGLEGVVGTPEGAQTADIAVWEEFGTAKEPPRPVLGPAAIRNKRAIELLLGAALVTGLVGRDQIHPSLGYDFKTKD